MKASNDSGRTRTTVESLLVHKSITVKDAMKKMDKLGEKILFVVDKDNRLLGSSTDGDIRRWILNDGVLSEGIEKVYNWYPIFI